MARLLRPKPRPGGAGPGPYIPPEPRSAWWVGSVRRGAWWGRGILQCNSRGIGRRLREGGARLLAAAWERGGGVRSRAGETQEPQPITPRSTSTPAAQPRTAPRSPAQPRPSLFQPYSSSPTPTPTPTLRFQAGCMKRCALCARCRYISFSSTAQDCSWFAECDMSRLHKDVPHFRTLRRSRHWSLPQRRDGVWNVHFTGQRGARAKAK